MVGRLNNLNSLTVHLLPSGWIFPVLSLLQDEQLYSSVPAGAGPRVVVLCPGHAECGHLAAVLRALAHFHAYSTIIQRDSEEPLLDLWPFAVEASNFREVWAARMRPVKEQVGGWRLGRLV